MRTYRGVCAEATAPPAMVCSKPRSSELVRSARTVVDDLIALTKDTNPRVRSFAILALPALRASGQSVVPLLVEKLEDTGEDESVRAAAAAGLGYFGKDATIAVPALYRAIELGTDQLYLASRESLFDLSKAGVEIDRSKIAGGIHTGPHGLEATPRQIAHRAFFHAITVN